MKIHSFIFALATAGLATTASAAEPYDFRGAKLGMSLTDFKALPFPDTESAARLMGKDGASWLQLHCTDEKTLPYGLSVYGNEALDANHGLRCQWKVAEHKEMLPAFRNGYTVHADGAWIAAGSVNSKDVSYDFTPDAAGTLRLFQIQLSAQNNNFDQLLLDLTTKFGKPTKVDEDDLQNGIGNHFKSARLTWDNGVSTVELQQRSHELDTLSLTYAETQLSADFWKKAVAAKGPPKL